MTERKQYAVVAELCKKFTNTSAAKLIEPMRRVRSENSRKLKLYHGHFLLKLSVINSRHFKVDLFPESSTISVVFRYILWMWRVEIGDVDGVHGTCCTLYSHLSHVSSAATRSM